MKNPRKNWWAWVVYLLLVVNSGTLGFFWINQFHKGQVMGGPQLKEFIADELHFDENQREEFYELVRFHQDQSAHLRSEILVAKKEYYQFEQKNPLSKTNLIEAYGKLDSLNYAHFAQIRGICRGEQVKEFDQLLDKILSSSNFGFTGPKEGH